MDIVKSSKPRGASVSEKKLSALAFCYYSLTVAIKPTIHCHLLGMGK